MASVGSLFVSGVSADPKNGAKAETHSDYTTTSTTTASFVIILLLVLVALVLFSFFLFKLWQNKKRQQQYARLLKLFQEDDELELELELGLRDWPTSLFFFLLSLLTFLHLRCISLYLFASSFSILINLLCILWKDSYFDLNVLLG